jgi:hypothetical protein
LARAIPGVSGTGRRLTPTTGAAGQFIEITTTTTGVDTTAAREKANTTDEPTQANFFRFACVIFSVMVKFLLFCILLVLCWPLALIALVLYPFVWLFLLPFRLVGIAVGGVLALVWAIVTLPLRLVRAIG